MKQILNNVVAKTILKKQDIIAKCNQGFSKFEIQLYTNDFFDIRKEAIDNLVNEYSKYCPDIVTVHSPLGSILDIYGSDSIDALRVVFNKNMQISLEETCALAQGFAKHYGHKIGVVIHLNNLVRNPISFS